MMNQLFSLTDKVAIVTGGAGFFGTPISTALAEAGAQVVIASRNVSTCEHLASGLSARGLLATAMSVDLEDESSIRALVEAVMAMFGRIDILVNNAVSRQGFQNLEEIEIEGWEAAQRVNATGLMLMTRAVIGPMKAAGGGSIINIGSIQGAVGPHFPVYGETGMTSPVNYTYDKWGMVGFTKWLANFYGRYNIRANCISPGGYGPGVAQLEGKEEFIENYKRLTPLGRFADDADIKGPVVFMASDASAFITGQNLLVDGGWTSW
ncbi:SDR family NAD(P)-dependent oxidoreductase [Dyadobacter jiangsuensis]|uniref:NAD(P)-dependent dehydrogenase (Short-subunit alcohol dehydrogenase family) n=1 Tax=Dyadobacter jiangsuensis TaxID=1591085 RepID=A0A2P8GB15_9BACT|nr:SDR family oxidoreductase [Dyadobacter jiangsuensis]PSL31160.1 NAD(P)-dependent dehydrogenase (short-subunit alcohol dehydrogenase family) [Dyadobacter jiangsuensis]